MKTVILSTAIKFTNEADVAAYKALSFEALPREDVEFNEVTRFIVGFEHIVAFGQNGRRLAVLKRRDYRGMALDGKPIKINGDDFKPFDTDSIEQTALRLLLENEGWAGYEGQAQMKKIIEINNSGLRVRAVNPETGAVLGDYYDNMTALILDNLHAKIEPDDEPDTTEGDWYVAVTPDYY